VIVKALPDGKQVHIKDVGRVELGSEFYKSFARLNGNPTAPLLVYLLPGANQIETTKAIYATMKSLSGSFPEDLVYEIPYDTTPAVTASIEGIEHTLLEAVVLVVLVVFLFLQSWRATLIPLLTVPVSLLGTFAVFAALGFSINTLTLFGMVLAIGIVVDDAIVVVEAVVHHMEQGLSPRDATVRAMHEVSGPVVGVALVLTSVFVPVAFLGGLTGRLYQQFALTIAVAVLFSALAALTVAPALSAVLLKPHARPGRLGRALFGTFDKLFGGLTRGYVRAASSLTRRAALSVALVALAAAGVGGFDRLLPTGFVPEEDQGLLAVNLQLPNAAALTRTDAASRKIEQIIAKTPGIEHQLTIGGLSVISNSFAPYSATFFAKLEPWDQRQAKGLSFGRIMAHLGRELSTLQEGIAFPFSIPPLPGFGAAGGVTFVLEDRSGSRSVAEMGQQLGQFFEAAKSRPEIARLFTAFDPGVPQVQLEIDRDKARKLGVPITDVFATLQAAFSGAYVNDFNRFGRIYRVFVQAEADKRRAPEDITQLHVRSRTTDAMIPLSSLVTLQPSSGAELTTRFNLYRAIEVVGAVAPGYSSGQALKALEEIAKAALPSDMHLDFTGLSYQQKNAPSPLPTFALALLVVFLLLAALYESWSLPLSVLLGTPFVALGALLGVWLRDYDYNVFVQVGLIMLIGLAAKNAILIVEFAKQRHERGDDLVTAALTAARLRFRPIVMTALAFIIGVVPLMYATGSGSVARRVMGTTVCFGMLVATVLGVLTVPALYVLIETLRARLSGAEHTPPGAVEPTPSAAE
jgi:hydrophobic/amphiphilic exporter-1 (mainly G- bacteria), HAE1 family